MAFCVIALAVSCAKLDRFSRDNSVLSFRVTAHTPEEMVLDQAVIEDNTVFIPVLFGKHKFPLRFTAEIETPPDVDRILGVNFGQDTLTLDNDESTLTFYVVAANGATRRYDIRARVTPLDENNMILPPVAYNSVAPSDAVLSTTAHTIADSGHVELLGVELQYPVAITPRLTIVDGASFGTIRRGDDGQAAAFENGATQLTFDDENTFYRVEVIAASGLEKEWKLYLRDCTLLGTDADYAATKYTVIEPKYCEVTEGEGGLVIKESIADVSTHTVKVVIEQQNAWPVTVRVQFPAKDWVDIVGAKRDTTFTFTSLNDVKKLYLIDSYDHNARLWTISLVEYRSNKADVLSFSYKWQTGSVAGAGINKSVLFNNKSGLIYPGDINDGGEVYIYPNERWIVLEYDEIYTNGGSDAAGAIAFLAKWWKITLRDMNITVSPGAVCSINSGSQIVWEQTQTSTQGFINAQALGEELRTFTVTAQDGTVATWSVKLKKKNFTRNSGCEITNLLVDKAIPSFASFEDEPVLLGQDTITLRLKDGERIFPLQIFPQVMVSQFAKVITPLPMVFSGPDAVYLLTVQAENGVNTKTYVVNLSLPQLADGADVTGITIGTPTPSTFTVTGQATIDPDTRTVTIPVVSEDAPFPLTIAYTNLTFTENATSTVSERGDFVFNRGREAITIPIVSQSGQVNTWEVRLDYRPQLRGWKLDSWGTANNKNCPLPAYSYGNPYWATSNNSFTQNVNPATGASGGSDRCAEMMSSTAPVVGILAAGSTFIGWFDFDHAVSAGTTDPVSLTFFGVPWHATAKIKEVLVDVNYHPGGTDWGSATVHLINWNGGGGSCIYHGNKPNGSNPSAGASPHPANTAASAASSTVRFGTGSGTTTYGESFISVQDGQWRQITIPVNGNVNYTHFAVVFSSSAYGDYFTGAAGSKLLIDNIRIVYEN